MGPYDDYEYDGDDGYDPELVEEELEELDWDAIEDEMDGLNGTGII